jgi:ATP-dependent 26S proteasome regulatory subunit
MNAVGAIRIDGMPDGVSADVAAVCRARLGWAVEELMTESRLKDIRLLVSTHGEETVETAIQQNSQEKLSTSNDEMDVESRARQYSATKPLWSINRLVAPETLMEELQSSIELIALEPLVFDVWGLREIEPFPRSVLNFHGPPGTGKTLAAHGVASALNRNIIVASYAQIESKFHGDGPKNVEALFHAALRDDAILFIDEADSLLSKRLTNVTQGSEQAINSMRSQLLICLEQHRGVVIFATNLVENYDSAFETRVRHIRFPLPDKNARKAIWCSHLPNQLPLAEDVDLQGLATASDSFCGREIKNAVIDAACRTARSGRPIISQNDFLGAIQRMQEARIREIVPTAEHSKIAGELAC